MKGKKGCGHKKNVSFSKAKSLPGISKTQTVKAAKGRSMK